jgi:nitrogen fixation protein NifZ
MQSDEPRPLEIYSRPVFHPGARVRTTRLVRNDGTFPGREIGEVLVEPGEVGYVREVGSFLSRHYVYVVELVARGVIVGMLARELEDLPFEERP